MLKVQLSVPELKREVLAIRSLTSDPMGALQRLAGDVRAGFEGFVNDLRVSVDREHLDRWMVNARIGIVNAKIGHGEHLDRGS